MRPSDNEAGLLCWFDPFHEMIWIEPLPYDAKRELVEQRMRRLAEGREVPDQPVQMEFFERELE